MSLQIIDCTLRDGSNAINFQFDEKLTRKVLQDLERSGLEWIDMGHGLGLGASKKSGKAASLSDDAYISIAGETLKTARYGFFFLKEFGVKEDIKRAAKKGIDFIRIGSNITQYREIKEYADYAKANGLWVNICLMKAYAVDVEEYQRIIEDMSKWDIDLITLMDSAGTFSPEQVKEFITKGRINSDISLGFHTHNNLQLAVSNAVTAVQAGAKEVDASVGGLGRSSGNAPTEILVLVLKKYGYNCKIDYKILADLNDNYIYPLIKDDHRFSSSAIIGGYAGFHSGFLPMVKRKSEENNKDFRDVIIKLCEKEKINVTEDLVDDILKDM